MKITNLGKHQTAAVADLGMMHSFTRNLEVQYASCICTGMYIQHVEMETIHKLN